MSPASTKADHADEMMTADLQKCYHSQTAGRASADQQGVGSYLTAAGDDPHHPRCCHL